jgi:hypothetical protein
MQTQTRKKLYQLMLSKFKCKSLTTAAAAAIIIIQFIFKVLANNAGLLRANNKILNTKIK